MCSSRWSRQRDFWLYQVSDDSLLEVIHHYVVMKPFDSETLTWLSSRGVAGRDAGDSFTEKLALKYGDYVPRNEARDGRFLCP